MSATELAALIVVAVIAGSLGALAISMVWRARDELTEGVGLAAFLIGLLAVLIFGVGACTAIGTDPDATSSSRCEPGTYDNGGNSNYGPVCVPWPARTHG